MRILVACEESQTVTIEFRKLGHEAYSCDVLPCSGGHPEWHLQQDVLPLLAEKWDMVLAFPPCTHLCVSGARWWKEKKADGRQADGQLFFMQFVWRTDHIQKLAIENPIGIMSSFYRKPDQIIQPWMFGDAFQKATCLWLKGLPPLLPTQIVSRGELYTTKSGKKRGGAWTMLLPPSPDRARIRSKTFPGVARAMASQWGGLGNG